MQNIDRYKVLQTLSIKDAIKKMDAGGIGVIICVDGNDNVVGIVTDGDFRRAVLGEVSLKNRISDIMNKDFFAVQSGYTKSDALKVFENPVSGHIPVLKGKKLVDILVREKFLSSEGVDIWDKSAIKQLQAPVVIMAGGKGTRMDPFTRILPKGLIPIGEKAMVEIIMDGFAKYGINDFYLMVNHKAAIFRLYFEDAAKSYTISFIEEDRPMGTAGALKYLEGKIQMPFFLINCDTVIDTNYSDIMDFHNEGKYKVTLVACMQHHVIPYGVCEIEQGGCLRSITEKPEYDILINTGMYVVDPDIIRFIPANSKFDMTDLISVLKKNRQRIGVYPVSEKSWNDIGQWDEYKKTIEKLRQMF